MILDTNALSALAEGDEALRNRLEGIQLPSIPAVVLGEYRFGIRGSRHRADYEAWLAANLGEYEILAVTADTASVYADLRHELKGMGRPIPENDLWICALAREHGMPVVSRDRHFGFVPGLRVESW